VSQANSSNTSTAQTRRTLLASLGVTVTEFRCQARVEPMGPEEPNPTHGIVLVRTGLFRRQVKDETVVADANQVLFFNAGEPYRYEHPIPGGDECTVLALETDRALELVERHAPRDAERPEQPFRIGDGLASTLAARRHYELLALLRCGGPRLAVEDVVAALADEAVGAAYRRRGVARGKESPGARRRRRELVEAAKLVVNDRLESLPSLGEMARGLGCSPFHLSRVFHLTAGLSLRAYALRLRARRAAVRLAAGAPDLSRLALDLGYADHSHLTNAFRREWGVPPSRFRRSHGAQPAASKIVQARGPVTA
jgi:AraC family transcriptional regulator